VDLLSKQNPALKDVKISHIVLGVFTLLFLLVLLDFGGEGITYALSYFLITFLSLFFF
jgi:hypothetical protein